MKIQILNNGYYDTTHEYRVAPLKAGDCLEVSNEQLPPPVKSKTGLWCDNGAFVETENFQVV